MGLVTIVVDNLIRIPLNTLDVAILRVLKDKFTYSNQEYFKKQAMGYYVKESERYIKAYVVNNNELQLPRGAILTIKAILTTYKYDYQIIDKRITCQHDIQYLTNDGSRLTKLQEKYATEMSKFSQRILLAPPGMGKTRTILKLCSLIKQKTLIVVHTTEIMKHWLAEVMAHTNVKTIGQIGVGKKTLGPITIAMIQTLNNLEDDEWADLNKKFGCVVVSECFSGHSQVYLGENKSTSIKDIVEKKAVKEVMSYNIEKGIYEKKKILSYMKTRTMGKMVSLRFQHGDKIIPITCTETHKFFTTNRGYIEAKDLNENDTFRFMDSNIVKSSVCAKCGKIMSPDQIGGHMVSAHNPQSQGNKSSKYWNSLTPIEKENKIKTMIEKRDTTEWRNKIASTKMGKLNPSTMINILKRIKRDNPHITKDEIKIEYNKYLMRHNPLHTRIPTSLERQVISMNIPGLRYTGDGSFWITHGRTNANPDFKVSGQNKVVEVGDVEYWHTLRDINKRKKHYKDSGYKCLYLTSLDLQNNSYEEIKAVIEHFVCNHEIKLIDKKRVDNRPRFVYNIEVEDNHNYIVNGVLVKNCQHTPAQKMMETVGKFKTHFRYGETASRTRKDKKEFLMFDCISSEIVEVPEEELHAIKRVLPVTVFMHRIPFLDAYTEEWIELVAEVVENKRRNEYIVEEIIKDADDNHKVLVLTDRKKHCAVMQALLAGRGVESVVLTSEVGFKDRKKLIKSVVEKNINIIIATSNLISEGANIPCLSSLHLITPSNNFELTKQKVGRVRRVVEGKNNPVVKDYVDSKTDFLNNMAKNRKRYYEKLGFSVQEIEYVGG